MLIEAVIIENYKSFKGRFELKLNEDINIIVGDNEAGKSTLLEAINLGITGQINGRSIGYELTPFLFNIDSVKEYLKKLNEGNNILPPRILIEIYFKKNAEFEQNFEGSINSKRENAQGISLEIAYNEDNQNEYNEYIKDIVSFT